MGLRNQTQSVRLDSKCPLSHLGSLVSFSVLKQMDRGWRLGCTSLRITVQICSAHLKARHIKWGSCVIQSPGIHRARWKDIATLCFIERPNFRTYGREQPRKIPSAMLWLLHAHTHTCTCTYIFVNTHMHTHACPQTVHTCKNLPCFYPSFPFLVLSKQSWQRWARQSAEPRGWTPGWHMAVSVMAFCLPPRPPEGGRGVWW